MTLMEIGKRCLCTCDWMLSLSCIACLVWLSSLHFVTVQVHELLGARLNMVANADSRVDWAMAEALAIGTLLLHRCVKHCIWL